MSISKRTKKIIFGTLAGIILVFCVGFVVTVHWISQHQREFIVNSLQKQFHGDVQLDSVEMTMYPHIQVIGSGLVIHQWGHDDAPPVISVKSFTAQAYWGALLRLPHHVAHVELVGLQITIPTGQPGDDDQTARTANFPARVLGVEIDDLHTDNAVVTVMPKNPAKQPQVLNITTLQGHSVSGDGELAAQATIHNAMPACDILSNGTFGPWDSDLPALTPVSGDFTLSNVDISSFKGVAGTLSAQGHYDGVIEKISTSGSAEAPNFSLIPANHPVDLKTDFQVVINGANDDTIVSGADVHFGHSTIHASGHIEGVPGQQGGAIHMDLHSGDARIEDVLFLTTPGDPAMNGNLKMNTSLVLPAGPQNDPMNQTIATGSFIIDKATFTDTSAQSKINTLSVRGQGNTEDVPTDYDAASEMHGDFGLQNGVITFSDLNFQVPGAQVHLVGTLGVQKQDFDMHGELDMDAPLSEMATGVKSFFLKAVNPLFKGPGGGTRVYFILLGTQKMPIYTLDLHHKAEQKAQNQQAPAGNTPSGGNAAASPSSANNPNSTKTPPSKAK